MESNSNLDYIKFNHKLKFNEWKELKSKQDYLEKLDTPTK